MTEEKKAKGIPHVFLAMGKMTEELAKAGIGKDKENKDQKYRFRGIDDVRNAVAPLQKDCQLLIYPKMLSRTEHERTTKSGGFALQVVVKIAMHFVSTVDGSEVVTEWENEAVDYSDKATNKAVSQAYKTAIINTFNIPTEGEEDTDTEKKELKGKKVGVFENAGLRDIYVDNCVKTFNEAETALQLKDREALYHDKLILMAHSEDQADKDAAAKIRQVYTERLQSLNTASKPKTVDGLKG